MNRSGGMQRIPVEVLIGILAECSRGGVVTGSGDGIGGESVRIGRGVEGGPLRAIKVNIRGRVVEGERNICTRRARSKKNTRLCLCRFLNSDEIILSSELYRSDNTLRNPKAEAFEVVLTT